MRKPLGREIKADVWKQHDLFVNNLVSDVKANCVCYHEIKNKEDTQRIPPLKRRHSETAEGYWSIGLLGKEMGYEISTCQMQHDAAD